MPLCGTSVAARSNCVRASTRPSSDPACAENRDEAAKLAWHGDGQRRAARGGGACDQGIVAPVVEVGVDRRAGALEIGVRRGNRSTGSDSRRQVPGDALHEPQLGHQLAHGPVRLVGPREHPSPRVAARGVGGAFHRLELGPVAAHVGDPVPSTGPAPSGIFTPGDSASGFSCIRRPDANCRRTSSRTARSILRGAHAKACVESRPRSVCFSTASSIDSSMPCRRKRM